MQTTSRLVLFGVLFIIGATVVGVAALADDLILYYSHKQQLATAQRIVELLEKLNTDYDALLNQVQHDPNMLKRIAPATLGTSPQEPNTAHPAARIEELLAARQTLFVAAPPAEEPSMVPPWLVRCSRPGHRFGLFLSGAGLVVVAFICFGPQTFTANPGRRPFRADSSARPKVLLPQEGETPEKEEPRG